MIVTLASPCYNLSQMNSRSPRSIFCPVCATGREISRAPRSLTRWVAKSFLLGSLLGLPIWFLFGPLLAFWAGLSLSLLSFLFYEVYDALKYKRELVCPVCSFDPLLYRKLPEAAKEQCLRKLREQEKLRMEKRLQDLRLSRLLEV